MCSSDLGRLAVVEVNGPVLQYLVCFVPFARDDQRIILLGESDSRFDRLTAIAYHPVSRRPLGEPRFDFIQNGVRIFRPRIVEKLLIGDIEIKNEEDLKKVKATLKPNEKFEGRLVVEDTRTIKVTLGERQ